MFWRRDNPAWPAVFETACYLLFVWACLKLYAQDFDETEINTLLTLVVPTLGAAYVKYAIMQKRDA